MEILLYLLIPLCVGWLLDKLFGEPPRRFHLIVCFGRIIAIGEHQLNRGNKLFLKGALTSSLLIAGTFVITLIGCSMLGARSTLPGVPEARGSITETGSLFNTSIIPLAYLLSGNEPARETAASSSSDFESNHSGIPILSDRLDITSSTYWYYIAVASFLVFCCLSGQTLRKEVRNVFRACDRSLEDGRRQVARIVGRDTSALSEQEVRTAALESLAENMSDGVIAPLFWYMLLGIPGMATYKMINTLDSMIGYRNKRYRLFGRFAARTDDVANFIPARLTALFMILISGKWSLFRFVIKNGNKHVSPNSGYPEAALAGILNCRFGGTHNYSGETVDKPYIGTNERALTSKDLDIALKNARRTEILTFIICIITLFLIT
jgi:adenosylcobinamide-phosphate synthase